MILKAIFLIDTMAIQSEYADHCMVGYIWGKGSGVGACCMIRIVCRHSNTGTSDFSAVIFHS